MTDDMRDGKLDEVLAAAVRSAPREREPSLLLEERTVRALYTAGVLRRPGSPRAGWWAAGIAASIALFACGVATGQWLGARQASVTVAQQQATLEGMASLVEQTGRAYVGALASLAERSDGTPDEAALVRQSALQFLHQAANEVVRMAPNDPVAAKILQGFDHAALQREPVNPRERRRQIMWF